MITKELTKLILDIRFYDSQKRKIDNSRPRVPLMLSERYALLLKESQLFTPGYDHIYLYLTSELEHGEFEYTNGEGRLIEFDCGIDSNRLIGKGAIEIENFYIGLITKVLKYLSNKHGLDRDIISRADELMLLERDALKIICRVKETRKYRITVSFSVSTKSVLYLEVRDLISGEVGSVCVANLVEPRDYYYLVSDVSVKDEKVIISPRKSQDAMLQFRNYYLLDLDKLGFLSDDGEKIAISMKKVFISK